MDKTQIGQLKMVFGKNKFSFIAENRKIIIQFIFTIFFIAVAIWFMKHEGAELGKVKNTLVTARGLWVLTGILLTITYLWLQGLMYFYGS